MIPKKLMYEYVCCLPEELAQRIMGDIAEAVDKLWLTDEEKQEAVENAYHSKVCDLVDTIEIKFA